MALQPVILKQGLKTAFWACHVLNIIFHFITYMEATQCGCGSPNPVAVDNELVCRGCCQVVGYEPYQEKAGVSKVNLYLQTENGGRTVKLPGGTKKLHFHSDDKGRISDICGKIAIKNTLQHDVLRIYRNVLGMKLSKAASACFAIYYVCRSEGVPFHEKDVRDAVCMAFSVQSAPTMLNVNFKVGKITDITGTAWFAKHAGMKKMPTTTEANPPVFYLRKHIQKFCIENPDVSFGYLCDRATELFNRLTVGNAETRAKEAVGLAARRACIK